MKTLIIIVLCCISFVVIGQTETTKSLIAKDKIWSTGYSLLGNFSNSEWFKVWKDSIIDGEKYSLIVNSSDEFHENWDTSNPSFLREVNNKVYFENYLYYDFTIRVGDTINFGFDMVVDSIKWQPILNGEIRKHWYLSTPNNKYNQVVWIEGIGSLGGLMDPTGGAYMGGGGTDLLCVHENGEQIYQSPYYDGCYVKMEEDSILPLFTKGKTWSIGHLGRSSSNKLSVNDWSEIVSIKRDTLIDGKRWWFLNISSGFNKDNLNLTNCGNFTTDGHKVYYENVTLYYDFGMQVGDTIDYGGDSWFVLDSIKPQQIYNLEYRSYYYLSHHYSSNFYHQTVWIEGIGCTAGLYEPTSGFETVGEFESLLCVEENGQQIYKTNSYDSCFIPRYPTIDFLQQKKRWSIANIDANSGDTTSYYYTIDGDTAIRSNYVIGSDYSLITHKKLFMSTHENYNKEDYIGGLVESANSVYFLSVGESTHYLLYDFGLLPGDVFIAQNESNDSIIVDSLIVKPFAGLERMHWYLHSLKNPDLVPITWVGGVGRLGDILHCRTRLKKDSVSSFLLCFEENGKQVYQNPLYNRCDLNYTSVPSLENHQQLIDLFSTGNGLLQLRLKSTISGEIMLYTLDGKQVLKEPVKEMESTICTPSSGLLLYRFVTEKGEVQAGKVVVR